MNLPRQIHSWSARSPKLRRFLKRASRRLARRLGRTSPETALMKHRYKGISS